MTNRELIDYCNMNKSGCVDCPYINKECNHFVKEVLYSPWMYDDNDEDFLNREVKQNE